LKNNNNPLVSIIIVNYNGKPLLEQCLESLSKVTYPNLEIILVDNNSTDDSIEFVKNSYPLSMIIKLDKNYGFAHPNNVGAKNAKGEFLLFLNNDTKVTPDFISEMIKTLKHDPKIAICQSLLLDPSGGVDSSGDFIDSIGIAYSSKNRIKKIREILSARGASMIIRKKIFEELKGFDEKFFVSFEDVDLGWRAWIMGYKVVVIPESIVYHLGGQTIKKIKSELSFHGLKNQLSMKITNFETSNAISAIIKFFFIYGFRIVRIMIDYKMKGHTTIKATDYEDVIAQKPNIRAFFKAIGWLFRNQGYLRKKHKQVNSSRIMKTENLVKLNLITKK